MNPTRRNTRNWAIKVAVIYHTLTVAVIANPLSQPCVSRTVTCTENGQIKCLQPNEICSERSNCSSIPDNAACEKALSHFTITSFVQPVQHPATTIENLTLQACAKFCQDEERFSCVGFQHHFESHDCRLLDSQFTQRNEKPTPTLLWITYELQGATIRPSNGNDIIFSDDRQGRGFETDFDSIVVEAADIPGLRFKRQGFSFPDATSSFGNLVANRGRSANSLPGTGSIFAGSCGSQGVSFEAPRRGARIVNGVVPPYGAYPWQAQILRKDRTNPTGWKHICGGSIISDRHIVTAIHCLMGYFENEFRIRVGQHDLRSLDEEEQVLTVKSYEHPGTYGTVGYDVGDIAIIHLSSPIKFGSKVSPICLPSSGSAYQTDTWCEVSGWGYQKAGDDSSGSDLLRAAAVPIISSDTCSTNEVYGNSPNKRFARDSMICAGFLQGGTDSCSGDSGGPLACKVNGRYELLGTVAWGEGCASKNKPGVYTKVLHYLDWIKKTVAKM